MNHDGERCELAHICSARRWPIYWLIIVSSTILVSSRIATLGIVTPRRVTSPLMSANDCSRWSTIRALGDHGSYSIDDVIKHNPSGIQWDTIDKVQHRNRNGVPRFYSSKPPLLPTVYSWLYLGVRSVTGWNLREHPLPVVRIMLLILHAIPWVVYLILLGKILDDFPIRDWSRYFILSVAGFATYLSTFAVSLNNHLPAAFCVIVATYGLIRLANHHRDSWFLHVLTGLTAALAAANELPALLFFVCAAVISGIRSPLRFLLGFCPPALLIAAGFFWTNYLAHGDWRLPYAHRSDGELIATVTGDLEPELILGRLPFEIQKSLSDYSLVVPKVESAAWPWSNDKEATRWIVTDQDKRIASIVADGPSEPFRVHAWDNWYDYPGSYWLTDNEKKSVIDRGQQDTGLYLFHVLFGHHGIFSLTPIWLLGLAGMFALAIDKQSNLRWLGAMTLLISIVVIGFYVLRPVCDRNYGGRTSAFRWAFWMAPLWLACMSPIVDWLGRNRWGRTCCLFLLFVSGLSAMYASQNPWIHPWLYEIWDLTGLPR